MGAQKSTPKLGEASLRDNEDPLGSPAPRGPRADEQAWFPQKSTRNLGEASLDDNEHSLGSPAARGPRADEQVWFPRKSPLDEVSYTCYTGDNLISSFYAQTYWCLALSPEERERPGTQCLCMYVISKFSGDS